MKILGLIPARGGSKGIPRKNLAPCAGLPLIAHSFRAAQGAEGLTWTILSSDSPEIIALAKASGIEAPFTRPVELASDTAPMIDVITHALTWAQSDGRAPDAVVLLQATSPLRTSRHITEAIQLFVESGADSVVSVCEVPHQFNPVSVMCLVDGKLSPWQEAKQITRRQDKPIVYARNGPAILIVGVATLASGRLYGADTRPYFMGPRESYDVDHAEDLEIVDFLLRKKSDVARK